MAATRAFALLACFLGLGSVAQAIDLAAIPSCGIKCVLQELNLSDCAITNQTCLCTDEVFIGQVEICVLASCTVKDSLGEVTKNQTDSACGVSPAEISHVMRYVRAFLLVFPTIPLIMRIANKCMKISPWGWDDTTIMIAYACLSIFIPVGYLSENAGTGRDIWTLKPEMITENLLIFYIASMFYITGLATIKASILFLYLRIFPETRFRRILWYTQLVNLMGYIAFIAAAIFACQPVSYFWTGWSKETEGKCISVHAFSEGHGGFNVILDVWMLLLPLSQIYNLNLRLQKKLGVMLMFGIGVL
ncbi:hypothetical protein LZ30DRAFT_432757 [Colletotrichum cereale]|nr:hypothetical protein LZ30DRAFT_432757 [Colletotrichum cereale]